MQHCEHAIASTDDQRCAMRQNMRAGGLHLFHTLGGGVKHALGKDRTWISDNPGVGKPSQYVASHLGQLSLLPSVRWSNEYQPSG